MKRFIHDLKLNYGFWPAFLYCLACAFPVAVILNTIIVIIMAACM